MLDIAIIREQPERVRQAMRDLFDEEALSRVDLVLELDTKYRALLTEVEEMRAEKNKVSKIIAQTRNPQERNAKIEQMKSLNVRLDRKEGDLAEIERTLNEEMLWIPNIPAADVPVGKGEEENVVLREWGEKPAFDFTPVPHWEIGPHLDIIDFERGAKRSGSRFYVLKGAGARLQRALIAWMIDVHTQQHGYTEIYPPFMVRGEMMQGTGNLPKFGENLYRDI